jgi:hypothetical protein
MSVSRPKFFRISLRAFLALMTLLCMWFGKISTEANSQREAVQWVKGHLGSVRYDWQLTAAPSGKATEPRGPRWLRRLVGDDYFQTAKQVWITDVDIEDLTPLTKLTELERLTLINNRLRDISPLAKLTRLKCLELSVNDIEDISPLVQLTDLTYLGVHRNPIAESKRPLDFSAIQRLNRFPESRRDVIEENMQIRPLLR